jgi:hypothetical protein
VKRNALAVVTTIAGNGHVEGIAEGTGSQVMFRYPYSVTLDASGNAFVSDLFNQRIRKVTPVGGAWVIVTFGHVLSEHKVTYHNHAILEFVCAYVLRELW